MLTVNSVSQLAFVFSAKIPFSYTVQPLRAVSLHALFRTVLYAIQVPLFASNAQQDTLFISGQDSACLFSLLIVSLSLIFEEVSTSVGYVRKVFFQHKTRVNAFLQTVTQLLTAKLAILLFVRLAGPAIF